MLTTNIERNRGLGFGAGRSIMGRIATTVACGAILSGATMGQQIDFAIQSFQVTRTGPETAQIHIDWSVQASGGAASPEIGLTIYDGEFNPVFSTFVPFTQNVSQCMGNGCHGCAEVIGGVLTAGDCGGAWGPLGFNNCPCYVAYPMNIDPTVLGPITGWGPNLLAVIDSSNAMFEVSENNNSKSAVIPAWCPGDLNGDRHVDLSDLASELSAYGSHTPPAGTDLDGDGVVGLSDLAAVLAQYGHTCP